MTTPERPTARVRIGEGWDIHQLVAGRPLVIGGVTLPYERGLLGHSDADVLLHAITDAILGAAALGDIGSHFPDTDERFRGADSAMLLAMNQVTGRPPRRTTRITMSSAVSKSRQRRCCLRRRAAR